MAARSAATTAITKTVSQRGRDQIGQSRMSVACQGRRRVMRISASLIRPAASPPTRNSYAYCPASSVLESANRENTATHWQNNTLPAAFVPTRPQLSTNVATSHCRFTLFPTLGTNSPSLAIAGTMGSRDAGSMARQGGQGAATGWTGSRDRVDREPRPGGQGAATGWTGSTARRGPG